MVIQTLIDARIHVCVQVSISVLCCTHLSKLSSIHQHRTASNHSTLLMTLPPVSLSFTGLTVHAGDLKHWRLVSHARWADLVPVPADHEAIPFIQSLAPTSHCPNGCRLGWCHQIVEGVVTETFKKDVGGWGDKRNGTGQIAPLYTCGCYPEIVDVEKSVGGVCVGSGIQELEYDCPDSCSCTCPYHTQWRSFKCSQLYCIILGFYEQQTWIQEWMVFGVD